MAFTGNTTHEMITALLSAENVSDMVARITPKAAPLLDWLTEGRGFKPTNNILHEYVQSYRLPNAIVNSTAIASATAVTAFQVNGLGEAITVGTLLENDTSYEVMQVTSIVGPNSIACSRNFDGVATSSLAAGGTLTVRAMASPEGSDHSGAMTHRLGVRTGNTVGYFRIELAASGSQLRQAVLGGENFSQAESNALIDLPKQLEVEIVRGRLNSANSLASTSTSRTLKGIKASLTSVNSYSANFSSSMAANPHLVIGDLWQQIYRNGASETETWAIVAGDTYFRHISNLNDTKVQDSNQSEAFKRVIRTYTGPFGQGEVFLSRALKAEELLLIPRERVVPVVYRPFERQVMGTQGDNIKTQFVGEYSLEVHHESAIGRVAGAQY